MYSDVDSQDNSSCASNTSWNIRKDKSQEDQKTIVYDDAVDDNKVDDLNKDLLHLHNGLGEKSMMVTTEMNTSSKLSYQ